jgi:ABC-type Na+ efflux pump permease subunit
MSLVLDYLSLPFMGLYLFIVWNIRSLDLKVVILLLFIPVLLAKIYIYRQTQRIRIRW